MVHMFLWYLIYGHPLNGTQQKGGSDGERNSSKQGLDANAAVLEAQQDGILEIASTAANSEASVKETEVDLSNQSGKERHILAFLQALLWFSAALPQLFDNMISMKAL